MKHHNCKSFNGDCWGWGWHGETAKAREPFIKAQLAKEREQE